jgi:hypothetical protein
MNSRIGSRMQQACNFRVRQAVEPVRNREDGTLKISVNTQEHVDRGAKEPQERKAACRLERQGDALRRGAGRGGRAIVSPREPEERLSDQDRTDPAIERPVNSMGASLTRWPFVS